MFMKPTELSSSTHDDTHQGLPDRTVGNGDVVQSNNLGADCSVDEPMPVFDSTLVEVPFSAAGAEDEKYTDGGLSGSLPCIWVTILQSYKVSSADELSGSY